MKEKKASGTPKSAQSNANPKDMTPDSKQEPEQQPELESPPSDNLFHGILKEATKSLENQVPNVQESKLPNEKNKAENIIKQANDRTQESILGFIAKSEDARLKRQNPVLYIVLLLVLLQLVVFNGLIIFVIYTALKNQTYGDLSLILEFLKYYIGAVLVEMIGMIVFITKSTFTSSTKEMLNVVKSWSKKGKNKKE